MKILLLCLFLPFMANADVVDSSANGFIILIERDIPVSPTQAYQQFAKINQWWLSDHTYYGKSENLSLSLKAGGCFCEIEGDKEVLHMTVSFVEPNKEVRLIGGLGPLQMMGISGGMSWKFESLGENKTKLIHRYQVSGSIKAGLDKLAPMVNKVQTLQVDSLVNKLNQQ